MIQTEQYIFEAKNAAAFEQLAVEIFRFQATNSATYNAFVRHLGIKPEDVTNVEQIPFLPINFFKTHTVKSSSDPDEVIFTSSATTGMTQSSHHVSNLSLYVNSFRRGFEIFYGAITDYCILALLPSYQEREGSSLIYMVDDLIRQSGHPKSGYFLHNHHELLETLKLLQHNNQKTILIGVTYALLDFVEQYSINFPSMVVMETGGMKGRRKEMVREELHKVLADGFGVQYIHSEYGMTELLGQAYSLGNGIFNCPPWMRISIRDVNDPLSIVGKNRTGGINVIDLSNIYSCSFIATEDLGRCLDDGRFEVLGRFDHSAVRGCNLLVQ